MVDLVPYMRFVYSTDFVTQKLRKILLNRKVCKKIFRITLLVLYYSKYLDNQQELENDEHVKMANLVPHMGLIYSNEFVRPKLRKL